MGNTLKNLESTFAGYFSIIMICAFTCKAIFSENNIFNLILFYFIIASEITLIYLCFKNYYNIKKFFLISLIVIIIFPLLHHVLFKYTSDNYTFNQEYLSYTKHQTSKLLDKHKGESDQYKILETLPKSIKEKWLIREHNTIQISHSDGYILIDSNQPKSLSGGGLPIPKPSVEFYNKQSKKIAVIILTTGQIQKELDSRRSDDESLEKKLKNPKLDIHFFDIWLDSITVFIFSNIKPIGRITQIIQLAQVFFTFIFGYMLATFLDNFQQLKITKKV